MQICIVLSMLLDFLHDLGQFCYKIIFMKKHSPIVACVTMNYKNILRFLPREAKSVSVFFIEVSQHILNYSLPVNSKQHSYQVTVTRVFTGTEAYLRSSRSSHQRCFLKKHALKNFAIFTQKHLCWSFFLTKLQA